MFYIEAEKERGGIKMAVRIKLRPTAQVEIQKLLETCSQHSQ